MAEGEPGYCRQDLGRLCSWLEAELLPWYGFSYHFHVCNCQFLVSGAGCTHGFATRADLAVPEQKFGKEDAFKESVEWFKKYLV